MELVFEYGFGCVFCCEVVFEFGDVSFECGEFVGGVVFGWIGYVVGVCVG